MPPNYLQKNMKYAIIDGNGPRAPPLSDKAEGSICIIKGMSLQATGITHCMETVNRYTGLAMCVRKCYERDVDFRYKGVYLSDDSIIWQARVDVYRPPFTTPNWHKETEWRGNLNSVICELAAEMKEIWQDKINRKSPRATPTPALSNKKKRR